MASIGIVVNGRISSTRCPQKLIRPFGGTTLFDIAMSKLSELSQNLKVYTGIADKELIDIAVKYPKVQILERSPEAVAPGYSDHKKVFAHFQHIDADYIMWLNPCHPLLSTHTILSAVDIASKAQYNSYTSVVPTTDWIFSDSGTPVTNKTPSMLSTAHCETYSKVAHAYHIINKNFFLKDYQYWSLTPNDPHLLPIPDIENFDVNTELEFTVAELAYNHFKNHS